MKSTNPQSKASPKVGANTTRGITSNQGRTVEVKQGIKNVNAAPGPRVGTQGSPGKRAAFLANKAEAAPLARVIQNAYAARTIPDHVDARYEGISPNTKQRSRSR